MNRPFFYYKERINIPPWKAKWLWFQCSVLTWGLAYYWCIQSVLYSLRHPPDYRWIKRCRLLILPILNGDHWTISKPDKNQGTYHVHMNRYKCGITRPGMKKATMMLKSWRSLHLRHIILTAGTKTCIYSILYNDNNNMDTVTKLQANFLRILQNILSIIHNFYFIFV